MIIPLTNKGTEIVIFLGLLIITQILCFVDYNFLVVGFLVLTFCLHHCLIENLNLWDIMWKGGGWCNTIRNCVYRKKTRRGSSIFMEKVLPFTGILSNKAEENPGLFSLSNCQHIWLIKKWNKYQHNSHIVLVAPPLHSQGWTQEGLAGGVGWCHPNFL